MELNPATHLVIEILLTCVGFLLACVLKVVWSRLDGLGKDYNKLKDELPEKYVRVGSHQELRQDIQGIFGEISQLRTYIHEEFRDHEHRFHSTRRQGDFNGN